jgi:hypothetical protein
MVQKKMIVKLIMKSKQQAAMMASPQHNENYVEEEDNYLFAETIEEEGLRLEQKKSK